MNKIIPSFKDSLFSSSIDTLGDIAEFGIDSLLNEGLFKEFPIVGLLIGVTKTAQNIHDRNLLRQTLNFIKQFNAGNIDEEKLKKYRYEISINSKKEEEELGRLLIILNNIIDLQKSTMLANLFRNYINEKINWFEFCEFSEIVRMLFISDIEYLKKIYAGKIKDTTNISLYPIDRLSSLGLINTSPKGLYPIDPDGKYSREEKFITLSKIGGKFYQSIIFN